MRVRGIVYDTGSEVITGRPSRPDLDPDQVREDLTDIAHDLHANAVRITGQHPEQMRLAAEEAASLGLAVWLSPALPDATPAEALNKLAGYARDAERLRAAGVDVVLLAGWEATLFQRGIVAGATTTDRMTTMSSPARLLWSVVRHGPFPRNLNRYLRAAATTIREQFGGPVSYAAAGFEQVDWSPFDIVAVDHYRSSANRDTYGDEIAQWTRHGRPVVLTEYGCATYRGAPERGALAWTVVDRSTDPPRIPDTVVRDEAAQAAELATLLDTIEASPTDGGFVFTYASFSYPHRPDDPRHDLDTAGYGLVTVLPDGTRRRKQAFNVVAQRYATSAAAT